MIYCAKRFLMTFTDPIEKCTLISFDTETTGKYPLESEICEIAAVKYQNGQVIDEYQTLIRPRRPMSQTVINIHGITNEMVQNEKPVEDVIKDFHDFIQGGILVAHHSPFDLGFLTVAFENKSLPLPELPVLCSSRLSRKIITDSKNHRLQTLIPHLGLYQGTAHRALDDAKACLELALKCIERGQIKTLQDAIDIQEGALYWKNYSLHGLRKSEHISRLLDAIENKTKVKMVYGGGSNPGKEREVKPIGVVRNPDGDFLVALDSSAHPKRYYMNKIKSVEPTQTTLF